MLRELARMSRGTSPSRQVSHPGGLLQEILAEVDVEGTTYRLSRLRQRPRPGSISLTPRESDIIRLVAKGMPTKAIGNALGISGWTVLTHLRRVFARLGVNSRAAMIARLSDEGLL
jgi:DNA-binding CsgD family transcriptional regulator